MKEITVVRIENHDILPIQQRHIEVNSIEELFSYLSKTNTARQITISHVGMESDPLWILYIRSAPNFLKTCQEDGYCGICGAKVDPEAKMPQFNTDDEGRISVERDFVYCDCCGKKIGKMQHHSPIDIFHQSTKRIDVIHEFTPIPIECGFCGGSGKIKVYDGEGIPLLEYHKCPYCLGEGHIEIECDLMQL